MSYKVLALKYRPQTFSGLTGQEHVSRTLQNAIDTGRVAHAFLFAGARGVGKTSTARILAKALNCEKGVSLEPCNICPQCIEITEGNSTDVFEIDGASNTGVDDVRELRDNSRYLPSHSRYKIYIIDEVHMLTTNAFNALLKTLEEPPPHVKFIFATTEPHKLPVTILSRCQRFDFKRVPIKKTVGRLREIADNEKIEISDTALEMIARKGDGSMRDSITCFDQVLAFCGSTVQDQDMAALVGVVDRRLLTDTSRSIFAGDCQAVLELVKQIDLYGYSVRQFTQELVSHFRNLLITASVPRPEEILDLAEAEQEDLKQQIAGQSPLDIQRRLTLLLKTEGEMHHSSFQRLLLEMALLRMAELQPVVPINQLLEQVRQLQAAPSSVTNLIAPPQTAPPEPPQPAAAKAEQQQTATKLRVAEKNWEGFVMFCMSQKPMTGTLLEHGAPIRLTEDTLEIGFATGSFELDSMKDRDNLQTVQELANSFFGQQIKLLIKPVVQTDGEGGKALSLAEKKKDEQRQRSEEIRREAEGHPVVKEALQLFDAEIAEITELGQTSPEN